MSSFYGSKGEDKENVENNDAEITMFSFFLSQLTYLIVDDVKRRIKKCK